MSQDLDISIVVACRSEVRHIRPFLDSLLAQDLSGFRWEAIIADGMSTDGTREILDEYCAAHPNLRWIDNPGRIVSTGLNAAIQAARGRLIIRMDAHTCYAPDYSRLCAETLEATGADNAGGPARTTVGGGLHRAIAAAYHSRFSTGGAAFHDPGYEGWVDTVAYGCWRKSKLQQIGLFDEAFVRNQDDELNLRLIRSGGKIWQNPQIRSWYSPRASLSGLFRQYFQYGFWKVAVIKKHKIPGSWRHLIPIVFVLAHMAFAAAVLVAAVTGSATALAYAAAGWGAMLGAYGLACAAASIAAARQHGWATLPYLPAVFASYHLSYGLGFLSGLLQLSRPPVRFSADSVYARITR